MRSSGWSGWGGRGGGLLVQRPALVAKALGSTRAAVAGGGGSGVAAWTVSWRGWEFLLTLVHVSHPPRSSGNCLNPAVYKFSALLNQLWSTARHFGIPKLIQEEEKKKK